MSPKSSDARIRASRKYTEKNYRKVSTYFTNNDMVAISKYCKDYKYSKNGLIVQAVKEKIQRDTGKSFDEFLKESEEIKSSSSGDTLSSLETETKKES